MENLSRVKITESLDKLESHLLHSPQLQKQIDSAIQQRAFYKKLYKDELEQSKLDNRPSLEKIQAETEKLQEKYDKLKHLYDAKLLNQAQKNEHFQQLITKKQQRKKQQEELFQKRYTAVKLKLETEKRKIEADFAQKHEESKQKLQEMIHINNNLVREHAKLLLQEQQITNSEENLELENTLKSRKIELAELEKQQNEDLAELNFLKLNATNVKPNDHPHLSNNDQQCGKHGNPGSSHGISKSFRNYNNSDIRGTTENNTQPRQQEFGYASNFPALSSTTRKHFDDEWTEEDYSRLQNNLFYTPTVKPSAETYSLPTASRNCNIQQGNQRKHGNKWYQKAVESKSEVTSTTDWKNLQSQPSTRGIKNANPKKDEYQPQTTVPSPNKIRKLTNESMPNVANQTHADPDVDEFRD